MTNCPFYGHTLYRNNSLIVSPPFLLLDSRGNQCGLVTDAFAPCRMETNGLPVEWRECPLMREVRMEHEPC
jgi:hypothetical protein